MTLLQNRVPYSALKKATDDEVIGWFACLHEQTKDVLTALQQGSK